MKAKIKLRKTIEKVREHDYNLVVWDGEKVVYNNFCIGKILNRRKAAEIQFKHFAKSYKL